MISNTFQTCGCALMVAKSRFFFVRISLAFTIVPTPELVMKVTPAKSSISVSGGSDRTSVII